MRALRAQFPAVRVVTGTARRSNVVADVPATIDTSNGPTVNGQAVVVNPTLAVRAAPDLTLRAQPVAVFVEKPLLPRPTLLRATAHVAVRSASRHRDQPLPESTLRLDRSPFRVDMQIQRAACENWSICNPLRATLYSRRAARSGRGLERECSAWFWPSACWPRCLLVC